MFAHERFQTISDLLARKQKLSVQELQRSLKISSATLRRDLAELEAAGKLIRIHGGVMHPSYYNGEPSYDQKTHENSAAKQAIAEAAMGLIGPNQTVFVDSGSTCMEIGKRLLSRKDLTVITNSIPLLAAAHSAQARVICIGGELRVVNKALVGSLSLKWMENLNADVAIIGSSGMSLDRGLTTTELTEAAIKECVMKMSTTRILVADSHKWNQRRAVTFAQFRDFDCWITDDGISSSVVRDVKKLMPQVVVASVKDTKSSRESAA